MKKIIIASLCCLFLSLPVLQVKALEAVVEESDMISEFVEFNKAPYVLRSSLRNDFSAFDCKITSNYKNPLKVINADIINGLEGYTAYYEKKEDSNIPLAAMWTILFPTGFITFGITWAVGILVTPFFWIEDFISNKKLKKESYIFSNKFPTDVLNMGDTVNFLVLTRIGQKPEVKLTVRDMKTKEIYTLRKN